MALSIHPIKSCALSHATLLSNHSTSSNTNTCHSSPLSHQRSLLTSLKSVSCNESLLLSRVPRGYSKLVSRPRSHVSIMAAFGKPGGVPSDILRRTPASSSSPLSLSPPGLGQFRPPPLPIPGLFTSSPPPSIIKKKEEEEEKEREKMELMERVTSGGSWQDRAAAISELQKRFGFTTETLYEKTFVSYDKQTAMVVALQVYNSLISVNASEEVLKQLREAEIELLYELRTLSAAQRKAAAHYMVDNGLGVKSVRELAKAMKDHERRPQGREGFTVAAADCLAFSLYRAACESTEEETRQAFVERALALTLSDTARARFSMFRDIVVS